MFYWLVLHKKSNSGYSNKQKTLVISVKEAAVRATFPLKMIKL